MFAISVNFQYTVRLFTPTFPGPQAQAVKQGIVSQGRAGQGKKLLMSRC
jgi:hypothetical protein